MIATRFARSQAKYEALKPCVSCRVFFSLLFNKSRLSTLLRVCRVVVDGLMGGHSGINIHEVTYSSKFSSTESGRFRRSYSFSRYTWEWVYYITNSLKTDIEAKETP